MADYAKALTTLCTVEGFFDLNTHFGACCIYNSKTIKAHFLVIAMVKLLLLLSLLLLQLIAPVNYISINSSIPAGPTKPTGKQFFLISLTWKNYLIQIGQEQSQS